MADQGTSPAINTQIESGKFSEKEAPQEPIHSSQKKELAEDEEEDEDIDALIEDLESQDGHMDE